MTHQPGAPLEAAVQKACLQALAARKIPAWRTNSGAMVIPAQGHHKRRFVRFAGVDGLSDLIGLLPPAGRMIAVECKRPGEQPTEAQFAFLALVNAAGGLGIWTDDPDDLLRQIDAGRPLR